MPVSSWPRCLAGRAEIRGYEGPESPVRPGQPMVPKNPTSLPGRLMRNRRSRKRLARSQEVSEAITQQWQAAPCRKSSGSCGVRLAQMGSDEQRVARVSALATVRSSRSWRRHLDQATEGAVAVGRGGDDEQPRRRGAAIRLRPGVQPLAQAGGGVAARHRQLADQHVAEGVEQPVPGRLQPRVRINVLGSLGEPPGKVAPVGGPESSATARCRARGLSQAATLASSSWRKMPSPRSSVATVHSG